MAYPHPAYPATPAYASFDYRTPPPSGAYYQTPRYSVFNATPSPRGSPKVHARRASHFEQPSAYYSARVPSAHHSSSARYFSSQQQPTTPLRNSENVSGYEYYSPGNRRSGGRPREAAAERSKYSYYHDGEDARHHQSSRRNPDGVRIVVDGDDDYYDERDYVHYDVPPPYEKFPPPPSHPHSRHQYHDDDYYHRYEHRRWAGTDPRFYHDQVPQYSTDPAKEPATPKANQARTRRASASYATGRAHQPQSQPQPAKPKPAPAKEKPASRKATAEDAQKAGIPAGYSYKNWDPNEEPITLLGSVFDANSLGKWIYDWTVFSHGPAHPISDIAGDLWLLLIQLAGKVKRADETIDRIRQEESRELVEDFLESGERLWVRFKKLLKICEDYMWKAAKKENGDKKPVSMGRNSGVEFVDSIFGRDRELEKTEKLMSAVRLWSMRFDANCDDILRNPAA